MPPGRGHRHHRTRRHRSAPTATTGHRTKERALASKFELFTDKAGKTRWRLKAANGEIIAAREAYQSKAGAHKGIDSVKHNAADAEVVDLT